MNKYDLVLDIIEHPDKYSDEAIADILSNEETARIYEAIALTASSVKSNDDNPDVGEEWIRFKKQNNLIGIRKPFKSGIRAASLGFLIVSSLAALALGIGVSIGVIGNKSHDMPKRNEIKKEYPLNALGQDAEPTALNDSTMVKTTSILYENAYLREILDEVCKAYNSPVKYENGNAPKLRLYFRLDTSASLQETIDRLNMFDSFDISLEGDTIRVK